MEKGECTPVIIYIRRVGSSKKGPITPFNRFGSYKKLKESSQSIIFLSALWRIFKKLDNKKNSRKLNTYLLTKKLIKYKKMEIFDIPTHVVKLTWSQKEKFATELVKIGSS